MSLHIDHPIGTKDIYQLLGTKDFRFDSVRYTHAKRGSPAHIGLSEISIGFAQWAQATAKFTLGKKDGVCVRERSDYYEGLLDDARDIHIFLCDTKHQRTTHTDGERLILQAILHAHDKKPYTIKSKTVDLEAASGMQGPRQAMLKNADVALNEGIPLRQSNSSKTIFFQDRDLEIYERLCSLQAYDSDDPPVALSMESSATIFGWEYMDIVTNTRRMKSNKVSLQKTCGSWPSFAVDDDIKGIFLIAEDFGDILQPIGYPASSCASWRTLPRGNDYLGIEVSSLAALFSEHGSASDENQLTSSGFAWHSPGLLFEPCENAASVAARCVCERVQEFVPRRNRLHPRRLIQAKPKPPRHLEMRDAVVFGHSRVKNSRRKKGFPAITKSLSRSGTNLDAELVARTESMVDLQSRLPPESDHARNSPTSFTEIPQSMRV